MNRKSIVFFSFALAAAAGALSARPPLDPIDVPAADDALAVEPPFHDEPIVGRPIDNPGAFSITSQPASVSTCLGQSVAFRVTAPNAVLYTWVHTDPEGRTTIFKPQTTPELTLTAATIADEGVYTCGVTDKNGTTIDSRPAELTLSRGDLDCSGTIDSGDFLAFLIAYAAGDLTLDLDSSGGLDAWDFSVFVMAFAAGA